MIIWSGLGFLVALITFFFLLGSELVSESLTGDNAYYQNHGWIKFVGFFLAAAVVWPVGRYLGRKPGKILIEMETGQAVELKRSDSLFFIRMEYWGPILCVLGIVFAFV